MKPPTKILLGLLTLLPPAFFVLLVFRMVGIMSEVMNGSTYDQNHMMQQMRSMLLPGLITTLVSLLLMVVYLIDANKNPEVSEGGRFVWMMLFIFAGFITMPVYYILYIHPWRTSQPAPDA